MIETKSIFIEMLLGIQNRFDEHLPEFRYINQDLGQLEDPSDRPPVAWPCCLVDFSDTNYADLLRGVQEANLCTVVFRLGFNPYSATSSLQPDTVKEKGLEYLTLEHKVYQVFQGWTCNDLCSPFTRIRAVTEKREEDRFRVRSLIWTTAFQDNGAASGNIKLKRPPSLSTGIISDL